jgi:hypothetical protein
MKFVRQLNAYKQQNNTSCVSPTAVGHFIKRDAVRNEGKRTDVGVFLRAK